jgi:hypothetical protein
LPPLVSRRYDPKGVTSPLAARRLELHAAARRNPSAFLAIDAGSVRFHLGTSLADFAVPVWVAPDARAAIDAAVTEIALLLATHHRFVPDDDRDRLIVHERYAQLPAVEPLLGPSSGGPDLRGAAQLAPAVHPALTGGLATAWLGRGGKGNGLAALLIALWKRAFDEMEASGGKEETPLLVALAVSGALHGLDARIRDLLPSPPLDRYLRGAALGAVWIAARTGLARAWRDAGRKVNDPLLLGIEAALGPAAILGGRQAVLAGGATLYGCEFAAGIPRADDLVARLAGGADAGAVAGELASALGAEEELGRRAEGAIAAQGIRERIAAVVLAAEATGQEGEVPRLRDLLAAPGALAAALAEEPGRKELAALLAGAGLGGDAASAGQEAARAVKGWKAREPAAALGLRREEARAEYAAAASALLCDLALDRLAATARKALAWRTGAEAEGGADAEWEAGRLYRLSGRPGAIRREGGEQLVGHLFADIKDFTRRTSLLGQASMAELLRREFFVPFLVLAKEHFGGMSHLSDRGGVTVNNLVGDAISLSGRIEAMVAMARDVRRHFAAYAARLQREIGRDALAQRLEAIEREHAAGIATAVRARTEAQAAVDRAPAGSQEQGSAQYRLARAAEDEGRRIEERDKAVARARGEAIEAGIFVSHGPAPLAIAIDDEVFGRQRVAIADKINESARGTARNAAARARADAELAAERRARGAARIEHAWRVFVGQPLAVSVPPGVAEEAVRTFADGNHPAAMRLVAPAVRAAIDAAARAREDASGDIYNSGVALSEEALQAWLAEVAEERVVRRLDLAPADAPEAVRARWFLGTDRLALVACFRPDGRPAELFRRAGRAAFKGLGEVVAWELCDEQGGAGALLQHFGPAWFKGTGH